MNWFKNRKTIDQSSLIFWKKPLSYYGTLNSDILCPHYLHLEFILIVDVITVRKPEDMEDNETTFKPDMSHQVYGDRWASCHVMDNLADLCISCDSH